MPDQPEQSDQDFADELAVATENLRVRLAKRLDAGQVADAHKVALKLGQYKLREAYLELVKVARAPRTQSGAAE